MTDDCRRHLRFKVKELFTIFTRRFGYFHLCSDIMKYCCNSDGLYIHSCTSLKAV